MKYSKLKLSIMTALGFVLAACGNVAEEPAPPAANDPAPGTPTVTTPAEPTQDEVTISIAWWGGENRHNRTIEVIELFMDTYPHITVLYDFAGWDDYWTLLNTQAAGRNLPDIIQMDVTRITEFSENNLIIGLNDLINAGYIDLSDVNPAYQEVVQIDGQNMAISLGANGFAMVYNTEMAAELGFEFTPDLTWDEFRDFLTATRAAKGDDFYGFGFGAEYEVFNVFVRDAGYSVYGRDGGLGFEEETLVDFFEILSYFNNNRIAVTPEREDAVVEGGELLHNGVIIAEMFASNQIIGTQAAVDAELGLALLPRIDGGRGGNWIRSSMGFSITSQSEEQEAAAKFINFFTNSLEANEILEAERGAPISATVRNHLSGIVDPVVAKTFEILPVLAANASPADPIPPRGQVEVRSAFLRIAEGLRHNQLTPEQAAQQFMTEASSILD